MQTTFHHTSPHAEGELVCTCGFDIRGITDFPQDALDLIGNSWQDHVVEAMHSSITYTGATGLHTTSSGLISLDSPASQAGSGTGTALPPAISLLVQKRTGFAGKKNRGRMFLPGLPAEHLEGGNKGSVTSFALSIWQPAMDAFKDDITTAAINLVVLHQEPNSDLPRVINELNVAVRVATQRGRQRD
jgi:hypothetical protein